MERRAVTEAHLPPELLEFLERLSKHNNRDWFEANKSAYESAVRDPLVSFVEAFGTQLRRISRQLVADASSSGGSISRIYRDLRFSKDRGPYKTEMALHFWHRGSKAGCQAPSYYLRIAPGECLGGGGVWQPDSATLKKVRDAIVRQPQSWQSVLDVGLPIEGKKLQRPPAGYPKDHRFAADLLRKSFLISQEFTDERVCSRTFLKDYTALCERMMPFMRFLTNAVGLQW